MLALISPAKKLDFTEPPQRLAASQPRFLREAGDLAGAARKLRRADLQRLMKLSEGLADLTYQRFKAFKAEAKTRGAKQAVLAFNGDTYIGLDAATLDPDDLAYAQDHLRILSGLYGLLRPLDRIEPYRLEMGSRLATAAGPDLYAFWGDKLGAEIDAALAGHAHAVVVNLASNEYFKAARPKTLKARIITPVFKEVRDGQARVLGFLAKRNRGAMARFMIRNRIEEPDGLKSFTQGGYKYQEKLSDGGTWVFTREAR